MHSTSLKSRTKEKNDLEADASRRVETPFGLSLSRVSSRGVGEIPFKTFHCTFRPSRINMAKLLLLLLIVASTTNGAPQLLQNLQNALPIQGVSLPVFDLNGLLQSLYRLQVSLFGTCTNIWPFSIFNPCPEPRVIRATTRRTTTTTTTRRTTPPPEPTCAEDAMEISGRCFMAQGETKSYSTAQDTCEMMGGKIAEPLTLTDLMSVAQLETDKDFWVGFNDRDAEGVFVLTSDSETVVTQFLMDEGMWGKDEPDNGPGNAGDCVRYKQAAKGLADYKCESDTKATCICEMPLV